MWTDKESDSDYLNFSEVSQLAVNILTSPGMLPVSLGVFGNWGAGKSSLLKLIETEIISSGNDRIVLNFDAWLYQGFDDARASLLEVIVRELDQAAQGNENLLEKTKSLLARVDGFRALGLIAEGTALSFGVPTGGLLARLGGVFANLKDGIQEEGEFQEAVEAGKAAKEASRGLLKKAVATSPPQQIDAFRKEYGEILTELGKPLIVIIDNLDRCLPANAIQTLEAIRLFLFLPNTAFVIAADEEMIRSAVAEHFKGASGRHQIDYLDKLIQVPIRVPKAGVREIRSYLFMLFAIDYGVSGDQLERLRSGLETSLQQSWQQDPILKSEALDLTERADDVELARAFDLADRIAPILAQSPIIHGNPRIVKRLLNVIKMRSQIARRRSIPLDENIIAKLVIFERCAGSDATEDLYRLIDNEKGNPRVFKELEDPDETDGLRTAPESWKTNSTVKTFVLQWAKLEPSLKEVDLRAATYLSRETLPIGAYVVGLSPKGREALQVLVDVSNLSSPAGKEVALGVPLEDQMPVMEAVIDHLRQVTDWSKRPKGFAGACLLASQSVDAAKTFKRYIGGLGELRPWMKSALKNQAWYEEG